MSAWTMSTTRSDGSARRGGAVHRAPADIPGVGRFAVVAGIRRGPRSTCSCRTATPAAPNAGRRDAGAHRLARAACGGLGGVVRCFRFYAALFGWTKATEVDLGPMGIYQLFAGGRRRDGRRDLDQPRRGGKAVLDGIYVNVDNAEAAVARITHAGGQVVRGPHEGAGRQPHRPRPRSARRGVRGGRPPRQAEAGVARERDPARQRDLRVNAISGSTRSRCGAGICAVRAVLSWHFTPELDGSTMANDGVDATASGFLLDESGPAAAAHLQMVQLRSGSPAGLRCGDGFSGRTIGAGGDRTPPSANRITGISAAPAATTRRTRWPPPSPDGCAPATAARLTRSSAGR